MEARNQLQSFEVGACHQDARLDRYLTEIYQDQSRNFFQKLIRSGKVSVNGEQICKTGYALDCGDLVAVSVPEAQSVNIQAENIPLDILYEDEDILIVNKPKGMVVHPSAGHYSQTLVNAVMFHCAKALSGINGEIRPGIVHRIDMDTTGALIVCKNDTAHIKIAEQIRNHTVTRRYRGIVCGVVKKDTGTICGSIGRHPQQRKKMAVNEKCGKPAVTHYRVLKRSDRLTYMEFELETGRTHQIRVHLASIGHPLLGDALYGNPKGFPSKGLCGQTLHAMVIGFVHPATGAYMEFTAPLPDYFKMLLQKYGMWDDADDREERDGKTGIG